MQCMYLIYSHFNYIGVQMHNSDLGGIQLAKSALKFLGSHSRTQAAIKVVISLIMIDRFNC